jgi:hypothetical protein
VLRSTVSSIGFNDLNKRGSVAGKMAGTSVNIIPSYELTKEELRDKTIEREIDVKQKIINKINPSL